jgi:hypothetical protein
MIRHHGWSHIIVTLNDLHVNRVVMHYFISYRDSNIICCINKVVAIFAKVETDTSAEDEEIKDFSVRKGYTISCYYELPKMFIPYDAPFLIAW